MIKAILELNAKALLTCTFQRTTACKETDVWEIKGEIQYAFPGLNRPFYPDWKEKEFPGHVPLMFLS